MPTETERPVRAGAMALPWLALAALWLAFELPAAIRPDHVDLLALRPTGDIAAILAAYAATYRSRGSRLLRGLLAALVAVLFVVRVDRTAFLVASRTEPLLYDQLFMLRHVVVLVLDLSGLPPLVPALAVAVGATILGFGLRALLRRAAPLFAPTHSRRTALVSLSTLCLLLGATALGPRSSSVPWVRWMAPALATNIVDSLHAYRATARRVPDSPYRTYETLSLDRKPDVFVFFVESYGRVIADHPLMRPSWAASLSAMEATLAASGWYAASGYGTAPVSGGRSWLAVGSFLMGTNIRYEPAFERLVEQANRVPTLVRFLSAQGYETVHLAPSDRARPGVAPENRYGYDHYVRFEDLGYVGPHFGWGIVPDQYALAHTAEHVLSTARHPLYFDFQMVSSHATWGRVPAYVEDWRSPIPLSPTIARRATTPLSCASALPERLRDGFEQSVLYDLHVIEEFLKARRGDALVIVMGDHQPPLISRETDGFDVPVHVLSRDEKRLDEFLAAGFSRGLTPPPGALPAATLAGFFSLTVRALVGSPRGGAPEPAYHRDGVEL